MPKGIHIAHVPIDAAIGWEQEDGSRAHRLAGETVDDNMAHPERIAQLYLELHRQHRSTWAYEVVLRPWTETWFPLIESVGLSDGIQHGAESYFTEESPTPGPALLVLIKGYWSSIRTPIF